MNKELCFFDIVLRYSVLPQQHAHPFHEFFFNYGTGGEQLVGEKCTVMEQDELYFFPAGQQHIGNGKCHGGVIYVGTGFFDPFVPGEEEAHTVLEHLRKRAQEGNNRIPLSEPATRKVRELFKQFLAEFRAGRRGTYLAWHLLIMRLLLIIMRQMKPEELAEVSLKRFSAREQIDQACVFIRANYGGNLRVEMAARAAGMSRSHFLAMFHKQTGTTFTEYVNKLRCERAAALLAEGCGVPEAAMRSGFRSVSNFYRAFRTITGSPPGDFRK